MFEIWCIEANGERALVRNDVADKMLARALISHANHGAAVRGEAHRYQAVPDPDAIVSELQEQENIMSRPYCTTKKRYSEPELRQLGFRPEGSAFVKRGGCRLVLAEATGNNGSYRVTPYVRGWNK